MSEVPILGQQDGPKCPHCEAQPLQFANMPLMNPAGQTFMIFFCVACKATINIEFLGIEQRVQAPSPLTMKRHM